jgi:hypothetical protein
MTVPSAPASRHVPAEAVKRLLAQLTDSHVMSTGPPDEVLRRSEMSARRDLCVSDLREYVSECVQLHGRWTSSQSVNPCG